MRCCISGRRTRHLVVPAVHVVLITGTTLLNDTLEGLLALCRPETRVVMVGPTPQHIHRSELKIYQ
jgi:uncharacterized protein (DUF4213/DUF364 family)